MAQNLAQKMSPKVVERFSTISLTDGGVNQDYDWDGVTTVNVYSVDTATMNNYARTGDDRFGPLNDAGDTKQALTLSRDRSFATVIDRRNNDESQGVLNPGKWLARQVREVITPEIDVYRLAAMATAIVANSKAFNTGASSSANAYVNFLACNASLSDSLVPMTNRIAFMSQAFYNYLKQSGYVLNADSAYADRKTGNLGTVDGVAVQIVPSSYFGQNFDLIIAHKSVVVSPMVMTDYFTHENPPGISGWRIEGRVVYDAFVLTSKINGLAGHKTA